MSKKSNRFSPEVRECEVRMVQDHPGEYSYDNASAETINGLYKAELIHRRTPWKTKGSLELATREWAHWFNHRRLL